MLPFLINLHNTVLALVSFVPYTFRSCRWMTTRSHNVALQVWCRSTLKHGECKQTGWRATGYEVISPAGRLMLVDRCVRHNEGTFSQLSLPVGGEAHGCKEQPATVVTATKIPVATRVGVTWKPLKHCICTPATSTVLLCVCQLRAGTQGKAAHCLTI